MSINIRRTKYLLPIIIMMVLNTAAVINIFITNTEISDGSAAADFDYQRLVAAEKEYRALVRSASIITPNGSMETMPDNKSARTCFYLNGEEQENWSERQEKLDEIAILASKAFASELYRSHSRLSRLEKIQIIAGKAKKWRYYHFHSRLWCRSDNTIAT